MIDEVEKRESLAKFGVNSAVFEECVEKFLFLGETPACHQQGHRVSHRQIPYIPMDAVDIVECIEHRWACCACVFPVDYSRDPASGNKDVIGTEIPVHHSHAACRAMKRLVEQLLDV